jgi:hypothetical protein
MESIGVYWIPVYEILEARHFKVHLVNARHLKHAPGRKSDVEDCQWIQPLHTCGPLNGSFRRRAICVPCEPTCFTGPHYSSIVLPISSTYIKPRSTEGQTQHPPQECPRV